jgi:pimeloyl-ACP methyl ester carboxylesterase
MRLLRELGRRSLSTHPVAWADAGPLYTEHMLFSGGGLDDGVGAPKLAVIMHGLLGAGRNLRGFTTELFQQVTKRSDDAWTTVFVDLRNHGRSSQRPGLSPPHTLEAAAKDVIATVQASWPSGQIDALIGHSLGGKVALEVTKQLGNKRNNTSDGNQNLPLPPHQVWCLDSIPGKVPEGVSDDVSNVIHTINEIPLPIPSREWLFAELNRRGHQNKGFQQWLASNLRLIPDTKQYEWMFNVSGATQMFESYRNTEYWDLLRSPPQPKTEIHLVKAAKGGRWNRGGNAMADRLFELEQELKKNGSESSRFHVHELPNVGHWLHAEDPKAVANLLAPYILKL